MIDEEDEEIEDLTKERQKYELEQIKEQFYHNLTPINIIESGRIRTYSAGQEIFQQGKLRNHMFIMKQGSATYYRLFPKDIIGTDIIPERIETIIDRNGTGGILLSNDFSFFDSEDITIIDKIEELDNQFLKMISYSLSHIYDKTNYSQETKKKTESDRNYEGNELPALRTEEEESAFAHYSHEKILEYHSKKFHRYDHYKNSLIANTRCEVIVIEIAEIIKSLQLFKSLIEISNTKYSQLLLTNEEIIRNYYFDKFWKQDRYLYLQLIEEERISKKLYESFYCNVMNNSNDQLYLKKQPMKENFRLHSTLYKDFAGEQHLSQFDHSSRPGTATLSAKRPTTAGASRKKKSREQNLREEKELEKQMRNELIEKEMVRFQYSKKYENILSSVQQSHAEGDQLMKLLEEKFSIRVSSPGKSKSKDTREDDSPPSTHRPVSPSVLPSSALYQRKTLIATTTINEKQKNKGDSSASISMTENVFSPSRPSTSKPSSVSNMRPQPVSSKSKINNSNGLLENSSPDSATQHVGESASSFRKNAIHINLHNVHDIRIQSEAAKRKDFNSAETEAKESRTQLAMIDQLWQCHAKSAAPGKSSNRRTTFRHSLGIKRPERDGISKTFNADLLSPHRRTAPEDFVQVRLTVILVFI
jgi:hypothetical protein